MFHTTVFIRCTMFLVQPISSTATWAVYVWIYRSMVSISAVMIIHPVYGRMSIHDYLFKWALLGVACLCSHDKCGLSRYLLVLYYATQTMCQYFQNFLNTTNSQVEKKITGPNQFIGNFLDFLLSVTLTRYYTMSNEDRQVPPVLTFLCHL